eukprot:UN32298
MNKERELRYLKDFFYLWKYRFAIEKRCQQAEENIRNNRTEKLMLKCFGGWILMSSNSIKACNFISTHNRAKLKKTFDNWAMKHRTNSIIHKSLKIHLKSTKRAAFYKWQWDFREELRR